MSFFKNTFDLLLRFRIEVLLKFGLIEYYPELLTFIYSSCKNLNVLFLRLLDAPTSKDLFMIYTSLFSGDKALDLELKLKLVMLYLQFDF